MKGMKKNCEQHRLITELTEAEYSLIRKESKRLEAMLSATVAEIRNTGKLNPQSETFRVYARSSGMSSATKWCRFSKGRRQTCCNLMAEALIEEFCALSQPEDVHTRQLYTLIWKHFVHAVSHCVRQ
ncbi:hypothetical protein Tcan_07955 [Toxocara canis]|uniref:Uncharacterized protein n=1 Tax=Toxocara canis TaxID=6265 RepID=A0A0B2VF16_TOXCA|nr:hypothetical protein Tcan_07955 [Toxocara canis]